jgi:hypothetical protein
VQRRGPFVFVVGVVALTVAAVSYAVLTLPAAGQAKRLVQPYGQWAEQHAASPRAMAEQCETVNETAAARNWCFSRQIAAARREWRRSSASRGVDWAASELAAKRDMYLIVGAYVLFTLAVGSLAVRLVTRLV